jgi:hypothetical protein
MTFVLSKVLGELKSIEQEQRPGHLFRWRVAAPGLREAPCLLSLSRVEQLGLVLSHRLGPRTTKGFGSKLYWFRLHATQRTRHSTCPS